MAARHYYRGDGGSFVEIVDAVARVGWETREQAEEGSTPMSTIVFDDPGMALDIVGHREYMIVEDASTGTDDVIYSGYTADQEIGREGGEWMQPLARVWTVSLTDMNTIWQRRIMVGSDCNRPAETDVERMAWLLSTTEAGPFDDVTTFVDTTDGWDMDAADYRWQTFSQIADDCAQQSGRNWYAFRRLDGGVRKVTAWYGHTDSADYASILSLSNDPDDWTDATLEDGSSLVWPISTDTKLRRDPGRVYSGVALPYDGGTRYKQKNATGVAFTYRDTTMPAINVKSAAKADARAQRYLNTLDEQDETISTTVELPAELGTAIRAGMLLPCKATHLPGYDDFVDCRVLSCVVTPIAAGERYRLSLELAPLEVTTTNPVYGVFYLGHGPYDGSGQAYFETNGDAPGPGFEVRPTSAYLTKLSVGSPPRPNTPWYGWELAGDGTVDLRWSATTVGVLIDNISFTVTAQILVNGAAVASWTETVSGFLQGYASGFTISATDVPVVTGDIITTRITCDPPTMPFFRIPRGTGQGDEWFEVTGGSLS